MKYDSPEREKHDSQSDDEETEGIRLNELRSSEDTAKRKRKSLTISRRPRLPADFDFKSLRDSPRKTYGGDKTILLGVCLLGLLGYLISFLSVATTRYGHVLKVNVILMISDGYGPASETFAREYIQHLHTTDHPLAASGARWEFSGGFAGKDGIGKGGFGTLPLDRLLVGSSRTRSSNSLVTDSAAGATAFACGLKTYNGGIAVEPEQRDPCGTVLEAAQHRGYLTGLVATSRITHATPASFYSHVVDRDLEALIATHLLTSHPLNPQVDLAFGGGRCFFLPNTTADSCRPDDRDLFEEARNNGMPNARLITRAEDLSTLPESSDSLGTIGLFNNDHMEYEVDRIRMNDTVHREPSLKEMSMKALAILSSSAKSKKAHGFFVMIEGSRIDMAAHSNDPVGHLYDILAYQETVREVKRFVDTQNKAGWPTVMISVSDHETGGISLGRQLDPAIYPEYLWLPDVLTNATYSTFGLAREIVAATPTSESFLRERLTTALGIEDPQEDEIRSLQEHEEHVWELDKVLADMLSRRAQIGWATHGHSGVDVPLYAYGYSTETFRGSMENTAIGSYIEKVMDIDLAGTTELLKRTAKAWHDKNPPAAHLKENSTLQLAHYHGFDALGGQEEHLYLNVSGSALH